MIGFLLSMAITYPDCSLISLRIIPLWILKRTKMLRISRHSREEEGMEKSAHRGTYKFHSLTNLARIIKIWTEYIALVVKMYSIQDLAWHASWAQTS